MAKGEATATEEEIRKVFRKHFCKLTRTLISKRCVNFLWSQVAPQVAFVSFLAREAQNKERSKEYLELCDSLLNSVATQELGPLERLTVSQLAALEKLLDTVVAGFANRSSEEGLSAESYLDLQRRIFIQPKRVGRKREKLYDRAFQLHMDKGVPPAVIAEILEPEAFGWSPESVIDRYKHAIRRRKREHAQPGK